MAKAILVIDKPKSCEECPLLNEWGAICEIDPDTCPLIPAIGYVQPVGNMISWEDDSDD